MVGSSHGEREGDGGMSIDAVGASAPQAGHSRVSEAATAALAAAEHALFAPMGQPREVRDGERLFRRGDPGRVLVDVHSDWNHWYAHADAARYEAKRQGGNRVCWADGEPPART